MSRCRRAHRCWHTYSAPRQGGQRAGRAATSGRAGQVIVACRLVRRQAELQHAGAQAVTQLLPAACLGAGGCGRTVRSVPAVLDLPGRRGAAGLCGLCQQSSTSPAARCLTCRPPRPHTAAGHQRCFSRSCTRPGSALRRTRSWPGRRCRRSAPPEERPQQCKRCHDGQGPPEHSLPLKQCTLVRGARRGAPHASPVCSCHRRVDTAPCRSSRGAGRPAAGTARGQPTPGGCCCCCCRHRRHCQSPQAPPATQKMARLPLPPGSPPAQQRRPCSIPAMQCEPRQISICPRPWPAAVASLLATAATTRLSELLAAALSPALRAPVRRGRPRVTPRFTKAALQRSNGVFSAAFELSPSKSWPVYSCFAPAFRRVVPRSPVTGGQAAHHPFPRSASMVLGAGQDVALPRQHHHVWAWSDWAAGAPNRPGKPTPLHTPAATAPAAAQPASAILPAVPARVPGAGKARYTSSVCVLHLPLDLLPCPHGHHHLAAKLIPLRDHPGLAHQRDLACRGDATQPREGVRGRVALAACSPAKAPWLSAALTCLPPPPPRARARARAPCCDAPVVTPTPPLAPAPRSPHLSCGAGRRSPRR